MIGGLSRGVAALGAQIEGVDPGSRLETGPRGSAPRRVREARPKSDTPSKLPAASSNIPARYWLLPASITSNTEGLAGRLTDILRSWTISPTERKPALRTRCFPMPCTPGVTFCGGPVSRIRRPSPSSTRCFAGLRRKCARNSMLSFAGCRRLLLRTRFASGSLSSGEHSDNRKLKAGGRSAHRPQPRSAGSGSRRLYRWRRTRSPPRSHRTWFRTAESEADRYKRADRSPD